MDRFKVITSSYVLLVLPKENKILLSKRFQTGYQDGNYSLPAGHIEDNETLRQALVREAKEEIGIDVKIPDVNLVHVMHRKEKDIRVDFFFTVSSYQGVPKNCEPERCSKIIWSEMDQLPTNTIPYIKQAISCFQKGIFYSEIGW